MKVYLCGPMRGIPQFNFPAFDEAANVLEMRGYTVFNPAARDRDKAGFDPSGMDGTEDLAAHGFDLRKALAADTRWISRKADAVAVLPGWEKSSGARAEVALAHALGLPVAGLLAFTRYGIITTRVIKPDLPPSGTLNADGPKLRPETAAAAYEKAKSEAVWEALVRSKTGAHVTIDVPRVYPLDNLLTRSDPSGEVRTTSSTGGEKGAKPERFDLIPTGALAKVAQLYGRGAAKYAAHNWRRGYEWSKSYAALQRHATQFWGGEDTDDEMQLPHLAAVVFHALTLLTFMDEQKAFDDRYKGDKP